jgi:hypothetical protein
VLGLVATLDPWYMANSLAREFLPTTDIPTMVASVREIEALVAVGQRRTVSQILIEIMGDGDERRMWELDTALRPYGEHGDTNALLHQAWRRYPFGSRASRTPHTPSESPGGMPSARPHSPARTRTSRST